MQTSFFHKLSRALWVAIVLLMVLLAAYVSVGRLIAGNIGQYKDAILSELNYRVPFTIAADSVRGEWHSFTPVLVFTGLHLSVPESSEPPLALLEGRLAVDVFNSLRTRSLQLTRLSLTGLSLRGELSEEGKFRLTGFASGEEAVGDWVRELLLNLELVALRENLLQLRLPGGEVRDLDLELLLAREGSQRRVQGKLQSTRGAQISILGDGVGDPFRPENFSGELYLNVRTDDLAAARDVLTQRSPAYWAHGKLDLDLWLAWDKGEALLEAGLDASELDVVSDSGDLTLPVDRLSVDARIIKRRDRWTIYGSDLRIARGEQELLLPRLQLDMFGGAQRLRAADMDLTAANAMVLESGILPEKLQAIFEQLDLRGTVPSLQLSVGDLSRPAQDWSAQARFDNVALEPYKGAPGATSVRGYAQLGPGGGAVIVDSENPTLAFPTIYREPLFFDTLYGSLSLGWDAQRFWISSDLLTAEGEEGTARALFGLDVPLVQRPSGVEMELLVGLADASPSHRDKYLPYTLDEGLLDWLDGAIDGGQIEAGAFLWRGSLARQSSAMRTVQLGFNIAGSTLDYHPDWPAVQVERGTVFIDDTSVSVWSDKASLLQSEVRDLSVETWVNEARKVELAVNAEISASAEDGFKVLNESPLSSLVGNVFAQWQAEGAIEADLDLQMTLSDATAKPQVEVNTRWQDVNLLVEPGNLPVRALNGEFAYSSERGFSASGLSAQLWQESLSGELLQVHPGGSYDAATSTLRVAIASQADMADVRNWLQLQPLGLASGSASVDVALEIVPRQTPLLIVESDLVGVALDIPEPWNKRPEQSVPFRLEMPLAANGPPLRLSLGEQLFLALDIDEGEFTGGALGVSAPAPEVRASEFRVGGHASLVEGDQWMEFVSRYVLPPTASKEEIAAAGVEVTRGEAAQGGFSADQFRVVVEELKADEVQIFGWYVDNAQLDLLFEPAHWRLGVESPWLGGELVLAQRGGNSSLHIRHLDLDHLPTRNPAQAAGDTSEAAAQGAESSLDIPAMDVTIEALYQSDRVLGYLDFGLHSEFGVLTADTITGELAALRLDEQHPGHLVWHQGSAGRTELRAPVTFADLGKTLEYFGYERIVKTSSGAFDIDLLWTGAPQEFALATGRGSLDVDLGAGSFLEAPSGAAGALRVVSILNLADIVRRLSMSHMFESGIPFESVHGELRLDSGVIEVPQLDVRGSSSFQFSGMSNIEQRSLEGELVATLPVARNLPWIAALAANLPVAAGVFVVSKVFDKQFNRLSSAVYKIDGTWDEPEVKFDRIFDDSSKVSDKTSSKAKNETAPPD